MTIKDMSIGQKATVTSLGAKSEYRQKLLTMGIIPGTIIELIRIAPMGDPIQLKLRSYDLSIRKEEADIIRISII